MILALLVCFQDFDADALKKHVEVLAADEMKGRDNDTDECRKAAQYMADQFKAAGLKPGGTDGGWFHDFSTTFGTSGTKQFVGRNVVGIAEGTEFKKEYVVVNAHHDGLGIRGGKVHNGADDNASGCAALIELAKRFAAKPARRSVMFISFDCEEDGLLGSREFVKAKLYEDKAYAANVCFDVIGGDFLPWETDRIFALGAESGLADAVGKAEVKGLDVVRSGIYLIEPFGQNFPRSDYHNFRRAGVPFVFFSSGTGWTYHKEHDDVEHMNFPKLAKAAGFAGQVIRTLADGAKPAYVEKAKTDIAAEAKIMRAMCEKILENGETMKPSETLTRQLKEHLGSLGELIEKPDLADARGRMQKTMVTVFSVIAAYKPTSK